jgi:RHS repeat-associated protein
VGASKSTASQVDFDGRAVAYTDELANTTTSSYDQASRVTATARGSTPLSSVSYDAASRVASLTDNVAGGAFGFSYDASGRITSLARPNGVTTTTGYDPHGWPSAITSTATAGALPAAADSSYTYSPARRITAQVSQAQASSFAYDAAGRLSSQAVSGTTTTYAYDADSNRCATGATTCGAPSYTYDAADRITSSPGASSYAYNYRGDVTSMGSASVAYDANDHATSTNDAASPTATVVTTEVGPTGRVLQRSSSPGGDTLFGFGSASDSPAYSDPALLGVGIGPVTTYVNGPGGLLATDAGAVPTYPLTNAHGDIVGTTDVTGTFTPTPASDAFGVSSGTPPASGLGYLGNAERFTTGGALDLISMGVRLYDPSLGRFLQPDPVPGGSTNAYDYCYQDPVNCFDLAGTFSFRHFFKRVDTFASAATAILAAVTPICPVCGFLAQLTNGIAVISEGALVADDCLVNKRATCGSDAYTLLFSATTFGAGEYLKSFNASLKGSVAIGRALESETTAVAYSTRLTVQAASGKYRLP